MPGKQSNQKPLFILIAALVLAVAVQAWFLVDMHKQLREMRNTWNATADWSLPGVSPVDPGKAANIPGGAGNADPLDDWFNTPFAPDSWNPFRDMQQMQERMNRMFGNVFGHSGFNSGADPLPGSGSLSPKMDVKEEKNRYVVHVELPGADSNNVNVKLEDQTLTVSGTLEQRSEQKDRSGNLFRHERHTGTFSRTITLPSPVKQGSMKTAFKDGTLEIIIEKEPDIYT